MPQRQAGDIGATYQDAPTKSINVGGTRFVYRRLGADAGVPVIFLHHLGAVLDNWDPRVVDGIAAKHPVVTFDNRGVGASEGQTPDTVTTMADDAIAFVRALGFDQVDLLGFSLGGFVAQVIAQQEPQLVRKIILAGTGPAGGVGIGKVTFGTIRESIKATLTFRDPKELRLHANRQRQIGGATVREAAQGTEGQSRQIDYSARVPLPAQGHPCMGHAKAFGLDEHRPSGPDRKR